ncbi:succinic semialdehyde dehydrogenase [Cellulomonas soli]|uniref:Succinic semialdehyde dehydrogenase n=1 Tax=Cellulomonas soli TaxID=931535 RepID=A0A512P8W9_9CELL|nr:succinic semialdehyde dehydrogenase [Cellulomonas soli]NYI57869.1 succinate-semialdehyde dehydrogenase/glutarate-semialdehyde dehydrogenase [Cellulomonas soli]GEP67653.1 succinic semialdehyde dehydrogenase [Cellulomonas soli]
MSHDPGNAQLHDPETDPLATYVLEPDDVRTLLARIVTSPGAEHRTSYAPFTGAPIAAVPLSTPADVERAATVARAAQRRWAAAPLRTRTAVLRRLHDLLLARQSDVLDLVQLETGKSRASAYEEVADIALVARHYAARAGRYLAPRREPGVVPGLSSVRVLRHPLGVVGIIAPWNFPLTLTLGDVLPALVAGNAVILRPDPQTALTALWAAELLEDAGLPDGLLQIVVNEGRLLAPMLVDQVDHLSFTGSTAAGRVVAGQAGQALVPATLELGGKNPLYVAEDVDVETAARGAVRACFTGAGQVCVSIERLYVHEDVADAFLAAFVRNTRALRLGSGLDYRSDMGSLTSAAQLAKVVEHVEDAMGHGATVLTGAVHRTDLGPYFYEPTVLTDVPPEARLTREETFGPVVTVSRVASDDEAVAAMNDGEFALNASIWTRDVRRGARLAARVRSGQVNVNEGYMASWAAVGAPQGGSGTAGTGSRHGREGLWETTRLQTVAVQHGAHGVLGLPPLGLQRLFDLGTETWPQVFTQVLRASRALRLP